MSSIVSASSSALASASISVSSSDAVSSHDLNRARGFANKVLKTLAQERRSQIALIGIRDAIHMCNQYAAITVNEISNQALLRLNE